MKLPHLLTTTTARPALAARTTGPFMLRGPAVAFAPDDDLDPAFVEQPGDREPDPDEPAAEAEAEAAEEPEAEEEAEPEAEAEAAAEGEDEPAAAEAEDGEAEEAPKPPKKDWRDRQIIKARAAEKREREEKAALAKENEELKARLEADPDRLGDGIPVPREEAVRIAKEELRQEQLVTAINTAADAMFDAGVKAFPKTWETRVAAAADVFSDEMRARPDFLEAVTELDNSAAVYHELAGDPDEMERVLELPPHKMGMELARLSAKLSAAPKPKTVSRAPPPIKPLDKPGLQERSLEDLANDPSPAAGKEFDRRMAAEERKRYEAR